MTKKVDAPPEAVTKQVPATNHKGSSAKAEQGARMNETKRNPSKRSWQENQADSSMSGIEFRKVKTNELVNFVAIKHDEVLEHAKAFRIAIIVSEEDDTFVLPPKQTFEEMIQAKRRQQMLLYGAGGFSSNPSTLSERAARRVAAMARRQSSLNVAINRPIARNSNGTFSSTKAASKSSGSRSSRTRASKKPSTRSSASRKPAAPKNGGSKAMAKPTDPGAPSTSGASKPVAPAAPAVVLNTSDDSLTSEASNTKLITSMKELARQNPALGTTDKKAIKSLLRSAAPGASIVLSNGTVIKKSRRGGARAGAGRKRNRPASLASNGQLNTSSSSRDGERDTGDESRGTSHQDNDSTNHSFASVSAQPVVS